MKQEGGANRRRGLEYSKSEEKDGRAAWAAVIFPLGRKHQFFKPKNTNREIRFIVCAC